MGVFLQSPVALGEIRFLSTEEEVIGVPDFQDAIGMETSLIQDEQKNGKGEVTSALPSPDTHTQMSEKMEKSDSMHKTDQKKTVLVWKGWSVTVEVAKGEWLYLESRL